jgi:hypothetical protein
MLEVMDSDVALFLSFYAVLIQALASCQPSIFLEDNILTNGKTLVGSLIKSNDCALAISTLALYDYHICDLLLW